MSRGREQAVGAAGALLVVALAVAAWVAIGGKIVAFDGDGRPAMTLPPK